MKIIVDAMGGDHAPAAVIAGVVDAVRESDFHIVLVGIKERVEEELTKYQYPSDKISIVHAPEVISMHDSAISSVRKKRNSSITIGMDLLNQKEGRAFVSAGNTGAMVAAATFRLGMLNGVDRPGIGLVYPTLEGFSFLMDVGANTDPKPEHLLQSALMAEVYSKYVMGIDNPRVGLLNIGEESSKGTDFVKTTHKLLAEGMNNFIGNVEPNEIFVGRADCIICDGFVGNVIIKVSQGLMESMSKLLKREIKKSPFAVIGGLMMRNRLNHVRQIADYSEYGGAPLLGVNGIVMISHGRSSPKAIKNAIRATAREVEHNILAKMIEKFGSS